MGTIHPILDARETPQGRLERRGLSWGLTPSNHAPWALAIGLYEAADFFIFLEKGFTLCKSGIFVDQLSISSTSASEIQESAAPLFPFLLPSPLRMIYNSPPLSSGKRSKTLSGCLQPRIVPNPTYTMFFPIHTYL